MFHLETDLFISISLVSYVEEIHYAPCPLPNLSPFYPPPLPRLSDVWLLQWYGWSISLLPSLHPFFPSQFFSLPPFFPPSFLDLVPCIPSFSLGNFLPTRDCLVLYLYSLDIHTKALTFIFSFIIITCVCISMQNRYITFIVQYIKTVELMINICHRLDNGCS